MKFSSELASIHAYLCADGYVIRNPESQKHKYYYIGLRNTNEVLLKDFQNKFKVVFGLTPIITKDGRCKIQNKTIFFQLTENFSYYSGEWKIPKLSKEELKCWLRSFFDCESWIQVQKAKSRAIGVESINGKGLRQIKDVLQKEFEIHTSDVKKRKNRSVWYIHICGKDDLLRFKDNIGFLHPKKKARLQEALDSYETYEWTIPEEKEKLIKFINKRGRIRKDTKEIRFFSILKKNLIELKNKLIKYDINAKVYGPWKNNRGRIYYCLTIKQSELIKLKGD
ncbi:MAG: hypothetical protein ISS94_03550 [Candidatus Syntrophoarchaeum sp.]|nr:hypothetical protein [Candidatus Syntrophoarchaeum sp.]